MSPSTNPIFNGWLEALLYARPLLGVDETQDTYFRTDLEPSTRKHYAYAALRVDGRVKIFFTEGLANFLEIERQEIMVSAALRAFTLLHRISDPDEQRLANTLGVCRGGIVSDLSRRWGLIYAQTVPFTAVPETRRACGICLRPMASDIADSKVHPQCLLYARNRLKPAPRPAPISALDFD